MKSLITSNPIHFEYAEWQKDTQPNDDDEITIKVEIQIGEELLRYKTSFWQKLLQLWIQYLSTLIVFLWLADKLKDWLFAGRKVRALEVVPWKKAV